MNFPGQSPVVRHQHRPLNDASLFAQIVHGIACATTVEEVCTITVEYLQCLFAADRVVILQVPTTAEATTQQNSSRLNRPASYQIIAEQVQSPYQSLKTAQFPIELLALPGGEHHRGGSTIAANDLTQLPLQPATQTFCEHFAVRSQLMVAIHHNEQLWGTILVQQCGAPRSWQMTEIQWFQAFMPHLKLALHLPTTFSELRPELPTCPDLSRDASQLQDAIFILARDGVYQKAIYGCLGVNSPADQCPLPGQHLNAFLSSEITEQYLQACEQALAQQLPTCCEHQLLTPQGAQAKEVQMFPYDEQSVLVLVRDLTAQKLEEQGLQVMQQIQEQRIQERTAALRATDQDLLQEIVERVQIQSQLDRKNAEFAAIFRAIPDAILFVDLDRRIRRINPAFTRLFGYQLSEVEGESSALIYETKDAYEQQGYARYNTQATDKLHPYEVNYRQANGDIFASETVGTQVKDNNGNLLGFVGVVRDISDRKRAEAAIRESEARYRNFYENTPVMLHSVDPHCRLLNVSHYWLQKLGFTKAEVIGRHIVDFLSPESRQRAQRMYLPEFYQQGYCTDIPYEFVCKDGTVIDILLSAIAEYNDNQQITRSLAVLIDVTERHRAQAALRESEVRFRTMADTAPVLIWMADANQQFDYVNRVWLAFTGRTLAQEQGNGWQEHLHPDDRDLYQTECDRAFQDKAPFRLEFRLRQVNGGYRWLLSNGTPRLLPNGQLAGYIGSCVDITTQKQLAQELSDALSQEKELAQITLESIGDGVITTDAHGHITYLNPIAAELTSWPLTQAKGKPLDMVFEVIYESTLQPAENLVEQALHTGRRLSCTEHLALVNRQRQQYSIEESAAPIRDRHNQIIGAVLVFRDVSHARTLANQLSWQANHDALTGLMNRRFFENKLTLALESARQEQQQHVLCYLDLDQFKVVNDTCGHIAGDELLRQISTLIKLKIRASDSLARLGGDEFGILLYHCPLQSAMSVAETIRQAVYDFRFNWQGKTFGVGVSVGLVCLDNHSPNLASLLSAADTACYAAKDKGRNRILVYQPDDSELVSQRQERRWSVRIRQAIESDRFRLMRQPIVFAHDPWQSNIPHYEILLRMVSETGEIIPPSAFLPAAERYDVMPELDRWVIRRCFSHFAVNPLPPNRRYTINLSGASLNHDQFLVFLHEQFQQFAIAPEQICFEVTETTAIANLNQATEFMSELKNLGCYFALDDFGSGMSSFAYLRSLPVDFLKIDGRFVKDIVSDPTTYAIVESINHVGHVIGLKTIAEYVESQEIIAKLQEIGVDYLQGYATGRPEPWI